MTNYDSGYEDEGRFRDDLEEHHAAGWAEAQAEDADEDEDEDED